MLGRDPAKSSKFLPEKLPLRLRSPGACYESIPGSACLGQPPDSGVDLERIKRSGR